MGGLVARHWAVEVAGLRPAGRMSCARGQGNAELMLGLYCAVFLWRCSFTGAAGASAGFKQKAALRCSSGFFNLVPGAGIEPARLAAGDFELACEGVRLGK